MFRKQEERKKEDTEVIDLPKRKKHCNTIVPSRERTKAL